MTADPEEGRLPKVTVQPGTLLQRLSRSLTKDCLTWTPAFTGPGGDSESQVLWLFSQAQREELCRDLIIIIAFESPHLFHSGLQRTNGVNYVRNTELGLQGIQRKPDMVQAL